MSPATSPDAPPGRLLWSDNAWVNGWAGPSVFAVHADRLAYVGPVGSIPLPDTAGHLPGTVMPGFIDSHVHLGLVDAASLRSHGIAGVLDLGWDPVEARLWAAAGADPANLDVAFAGAFLTAPGGYPTDRSWAPAAASREISSGDVGAAAITEMAGLGAAVIKIALNSDAGAVWGDELLAEIVHLAHAAGLPVVAHTQGEGQAVRAALAGVDLLAHTPWTERLSSEEVAVLAARCAIISTLDIHGYGQYGSDFAVASDNLARFAAAGGRVLYGTDLGNGDLVEGINHRELAALLAAGLSTDQVMAALAGLTAEPAHFGARVSWISGPVVRDRSDFARWLATASVASIPQLEEIVE